MAKRYQMVFILILATTFASPVFALDADQVNAAQPPKTTHSSIKLDAFVTKLQILLDRAHFSPGQIDGKTGENVEKAIAAFAEVHRIHWESRWTPELWHSLTDSAPDNLFVNYTTTDADLRGPFLRQLPAKMEEMEGLRGLYYLSPRQELAELTSASNFSPHLIQKPGSSRLASHSSYRTSPEIDWGKRSLISSSTNQRKPSQLSIRKTTSSRFFQPRLAAMRSPLPPAD